MDQHFPKLHDPNVALFRPPELPFGQGRGGFFPICFHVQLYETLYVRSLLTTPVLRSLRLTRGVGVAGNCRCAVSEVEARRQVPFVELLLPLWYSSAGF